MYDTSVHCLTDSDLVTLACPQGHYINIQNANYYIGNAPSCPELHDDAACSLGVLTNMFRRTCYGRTNTCDVQVTKKSQSSASVICYDIMGAHYIGVKYQCGKSLL